MAFGVVPFLALICLLTLDQAVVTYVKDHQKEHILVCCYIVVIVLTRNEGRHRIVQACPVL